MKYKYKFHFFLGYHSTVIEQLPEGEQTIHVNPKDFWEATRMSFPDTAKMKSGSKYYAYVELRKMTPNIIGQGRTLDKAVDDLLKQIARHFDHDNDCGVKAVEPEY